MGEEADLVQVGITEIEGPNQALAGHPLAFTLRGFAVGAAVRVERRTERQVELTAWAPKEKQPEAWCGTPPHPKVGRFETVAPAAGSYVVRFRQPNGEVIDKQVVVASR